MKIQIGDNVYHFACGGPVKMLEDDEKEMLKQYNKAVKTIDKIHSDININDPLIFEYQGQEIKYSADQVRELDAIYDSEGGEDGDSILP